MIIITIITTTSTITNYHYYYHYYYRTEDEGHPPAGHPEGGRRLRFRRDRSLYIWGCYCIFTK